MCDICLAQEFLIILVPFPNNLNSVPEFDVLCDFNPEKLLRNQAFFDEKSI